MRVRHSYAKNGDGSISRSGGGGAASSRDLPVFGDTGEARFGTITVEAAIGAPGQERLLEPQEERSRLQLTVRDIALEDADVQLRGRLGALATGAERDEIHNFVSIDLAVDELADEATLKQTRETLRQFVRDHLQEPLERLPFFLGFNVEIMQKVGGDGSGADVSTGDAQPAALHAKRLLNSIRVNLLFGGTEEELRGYLEAPAPFSSFVRSVGIKIDVTPNILTLLGESGVGSARGLGSVDGSGDGSGNGNGSASRDEGKKWGETDGGSRNDKGTGKGSPSGSDEKSLDQHFKARISATATFDRVLSALAVCHIKSIRHSPTPCSHTKFPLMKRSLMPWHTPIFFD